jgi:hypothetical protein
VKKTYLLMLSDREFKNSLEISHGQKVCGGCTSLLNVATDHVNLSFLLVKLVALKQLCARAFVLYVIAQE